ncbi:uncharacterized protein A4U43_C03F29190 [Asparagus officinalis]|uniref:DNA-directed RNA polymerase III subunit RPC9 n=1 Tax=Asparagus officinalis TaxID=4686 RepID=A0A5P1FI06_ASPOF|nr:DNA-directed RNA polymerase III subunit RPC9-like [Asparagus officinalis]ONK76529.1 uncharacterized protein A4U43_C03F29190 [Asparagus officinalis]
MKILKKNDGPLTNFEVLEFLRSRGATSDPLGCLGSVAASECKVFDYLIQTPACNQTRKDVDEFLKRSENFDLAKAEKLNIINLRPSTQAEIYPIIEYCDKRFAGNEDEGISKVDELVQMVVEILPPPPKSEEETSDQNEEEAK